MFVIFICSVFCAITAVLIKLTVFSDLSLMKPSKQNKISVMAAINTIFIALFALKIQGNIVYILCLLSLCTLFLSGFNVLRRDRELAEVANKAERDNLVEMLTAIDLVALQNDEYKEGDFRRAVITKIQKLGRSSGVVIES